MTKLRALYGALASGAICLTLGTTTQAGEANYDVTGSMSEVSNSCVSPLIGIVGIDCSYNASEAPLPYFGPTMFARYYAPGTSPFQTAAGGDRPEPPVPDDGAELAITGALLIDDMDEITCNGDDTIEGSFILAAGTRTFTAGQGEWAEESWETGTIVFDLPATVPDQQNPSGGGCEYIIGGDPNGFPLLLETTAGDKFPVDALLYDSGPPAVLGPVSWTGPEPRGIGVGAFEGAMGIPISLNEAAFTGGTYDCKDFAGSDFDSPDACKTGESASTACKESGQNFCGGQRTQEEWQFRIVVDASGDILEDALIMASNDYIIFGTTPDSWDADVITFTADCTDCSVAKNDNYRMVTGTPSPVALDIGANDLAEALNTATTQLDIDAPGPTNGTCDAATYGPPGPVTGFVCQYTSPGNFASGDSFAYTLADGILTADAGLTATVTVEVEADVAPVANPFTVELDARGVDPVTLSASVDVTSDIPGNSGGNDPSAAVSAPPPTLGTAQDDGDVTITYTVTNGAAFLVKGTMDTFGYTITDANFGGGPTGPETADSTITVQLAAADPVAEDSVAGPIEGGIAVPFSAIVVLGNGSIDQHTADGDCDEGDVVITGMANTGSTVEVSGEYTAPEGFEGEVICEYTITDGEGDTATGEIVIDVISGAVILLPGSGSAVGPLSLSLLLVAPWLRARRKTQRIFRNGTDRTFPGVHR